MTLVQWDNDGANGMGTEPMGWGWGCAIGMGLRHWDWPVLVP